MSKQDRPHEGHMAASVGQGPIETPALIAFLRSTSNVDRLCLLKKNLRSINLTSPDLALHSAESIRDIRKNPVRE